MKLKNNNSLWFNYNCKKPKSFRIVDSKNKIYSVIVPVYNIDNIKIDHLLIHYSNYYYSNNYYSDVVLEEYMFKNFKLRTFEYSTTEDSFIRDTIPFKFITSIRLDNNIDKKYFKYKRSLKLKYICTC